ncbi:MAG: DMT family transporter [Rhodospirillales bacterium]|nr:DMT family transporter [Rhodospirillales bacterium]
MRALQRLFARTPQTLRGIGFMVASTVLFASMIACARRISFEMHGFEVTFFRSFFALVALAPLMLRGGFKPLRTRHWRLHALRAAFQVLSMLAFYVALAVSSLAKAVALDFTGPLFTAALAIAFLGERLRARRLLALAAGLGGALVIVRPGTDAFDLGSGLLLLSAAIGGFTWMCTKVLARTESSKTIALYAGLFMTPMSLLAALPVWRTPTGDELVWLSFVGLFGGLHVWTVAQALKDADVTAVVPFDFLRLVWAAMFGLFLFGEEPDPWTWIGGIVIFAAASMLSYREGRGERAAPVRP